MELPYPKPAGEFVLVPTEPTQEMLNAYDEARSATTYTAAGVETYNPHQSYWALLNAAPKPEDKVRDGVSNNIAPQGPTYHWRNGWYFCRGEGLAIHIWNADQAPIPALTIPAAEWDSIVGFLSHPDKP